MAPNNLDHYIDNSYQHSSKHDASHHHLNVDNDVNDIENTNLLLSIYSSITDNGQGRNKTKQTSGDYSICSLIGELIGRSLSIKYISAVFLFILIVIISVIYSHLSTVYPNGIHSSNVIPNLIWSDEFDGDNLDLTKWTYVNGNGCDVGLCGWGNNELEWYTPSNAHVSQGLLILEARKFVTGNSTSYTSAKIVSRGKADFGVITNDELKSSNNATTTLEVGRRFESRMKLPWGRGIWPAFWMLPTDSTYGSWPKSGEIDIMENIGKEGPNTVHGTVHYGLEWPQHQYSEAGITTISSDNLNETFHTFAVERLPGVIRWYIDDIEYSSITKEDMIPYNWPFDEDFYFILNFAVGGNWPGSPGYETLFPQRLEVDYVRVYEDVFPRILGKSVVDCSEKEVEYKIVNISPEDISFTWTVQQHATIKSGQGTSRILVNFDAIMSESNIVEGEIIKVQANRIDEKSASTSIGLAKIVEGIGIRVKIVDFDGKCISSSDTEVSNKQRKQHFDFDCGRPSSCTQYVLHKITDNEYNCGERIAWLMNDIGLDERDACIEVGYRQFHGHCGPCNPLLEL